VRPFSACDKLKLIKCALEGEKVTKICQQTGVSRKTFYSWLKKYKSSKTNIIHLALSDKRFKKIFSFKTLDQKEKLLIINKGLAKEASVSEICTNYQISRKTFYKWLKRYQERGENGLYDLRPKGKDHFRAISKETEEIVLQYIAQNPTLSVHRLARELDFIGHHGIQNLLLHQDLNTIAKRQLFAQGYITQPEIAPVPEYEVAARPTGARWRWLFAPFATIPKFVVRTPATWPLAIPLFLLVLYIFEFDKLLRPAMFFPAVALFFGMMFFFYSLKYYISLIFVMAFQGQSLPSSERQQNQEVCESKFGKFFAKLLGSNTTRTTAIAQNLDKVTLSRYPFVSVHLPLYNERRVVERLLNAVTSLDWPNFEVIVIDDSTDETTEMVKQQLTTDRRQLTKIFSSDELSIFESTKVGGPTVKLIHRSSRVGFKGAALQRALENTDSRAEYICVFDADFVPFPDTLQQFVKTFQVLNANETRMKIPRMDANISINSHNLNSPTNSHNIAAVQGYQWHVLNKSENWVTRGVRTEYAGSYVVERAGIELYGGLKQIAGSVFCIRADVIRKFGWGTSITEDFELTLRLYEAGYKVAFTPYIQAPAEAVSTVRRLIRQRMRWAEGHTYNVRKMYKKLLATKAMTGREKFEFLYLGPYYLQATFFIFGTLAWFIAETVVHAQLPFWTAAWGWSLVFVNFLSLPMMNLVGLFLEESDERDYLGIASFVLLSYLLVPFQAYAATKALFEKEEGPWFRTPKTGRITDVIGKSTFYRWIERLKLWPKPAVAMRMDANYGRINANPSTRLRTSERIPAFIPVSSFNPLSGYKIRAKRLPFVARGTIAGLLIIVILFNFLAFLPPVKEAQAVGTPKIEQQINIMDQEYSTNSSTAAPTDNSLGLIRWDSSKFSDLSNANSYVKFEAVTKSVNPAYGSWGQFNSSNYPVVAYRDSVNKLRLMRCGDTNCAGANETINQVNSEAVSGNILVGMKLDASQYPVIAYADSSNNLKVAHCNDIYCAGSNETVNLVNSETSYSGGQVSIVLDSSGYPVIAYADNTGGYNLKVAHCNDVNCAGSNENVNQVNSETVQNGWPFLLLDSLGYPVIVYASNGGGSALKVAHCNDANCAGSNENANQVNSETSASVHSMVFDSSGYPVIAYREGSASYLKVAHCNDANCAGANENVNQVNSETEYIGMDIKLDGSGYPVIAYFIGGASALKVAHCNDVNCAGSNETVNNVNSEDGGTVFMRLDASGYPVIICAASYAMVALKVAYCNDVNCAGSNETVNYALSTGGTVALYNSSGTQVATSAITSTSSTYTRVRSNDIKNDANFATDTDYSIRASIPGGQTVYFKAARLIIYQEGTNNASITKTQTQVEVGVYQSTALTSYTAVANAKTYCYGSTATSSETACTNNSAVVWNPTPTVYFEATLKGSGSAANLGQYSSLVLDSSGYPVIAHVGEANHLKLVHCNDVDCAGDNENINWINSETARADKLSLELDSSGYPVIAYRPSDSFALKVAHCNDANCAGGNENVNQVNSVTSNGGISLALDSLGYPVISHRDNPLKLVHCNDVNCAGSNENVNQVNSEGVLNNTSLTLDSSGYPVIAYRDLSTNAVELAHCNDANCAGSDETVNQINSETGASFPALTLDSSGYPVIAHDGSGNELKLSHCNDVNCAGSNENVSQINSEIVWGRPSLQLDSSGYPVIAYHNNSNALKLAHCNDANCAGGNENVNQVNIETAEWYTPLALDSSGYPIISYKNTSYYGVRLAHCNDVNCAGSNENVSTAATGIASIYAALYTTGGSKVSGSDVSTSSTDYTRVRSPAITLSGATEYKVYVYTEAGTAYIVNAKIVLEQSADSGISALETMQMYANAQVSTTTSNASKDFPNYFDSTKFSGSLAYRYEADLWIVNGKSPSGTNQSQISGISTSQVSTASDTAPTRHRSTNAAWSPTTGIYDTQLACTSCSNRTAYMSKSWLIIQTSGIPVPEIAIFALPGMLFLPRIIRWIKERRKKGKKMAGDRPQRKLIPAVLNTNMNKLKLI